MFLASPWLEIYVLTGHFPNFEQFKIDRYADFGQIKIDHPPSFLLYLGRLQ